jgi:hypothetical protein
MEKNDDGFLRNSFQVPGYRPPIKKYKVIARTAILSFAVLWFIYLLSSSSSADDWKLAMMRWKFWTVVGVPSLAPFVSSLKIMNLSEATWTVGNNALNISVPADLPSVV